MIHKVAWIEGWQVIPNSGIYNTIWSYYVRMGISSKKLTKVHMGVWIWMG